MRNLIFQISEAQLHFHFELLDSVKVQRNSDIAERYFGTMSKCNLNFAIKRTSHNENNAFFRFKLKKSK